MADKRMFTMKIVDSDAFLDMPLSTQCLYFHLNMRADDDGFVNNPKKVCRYVGAAEDDLKLLIAKRFILTFDNGLIVIKHWKMHNTIRKDRYNKTQYKEEFDSLYIKENGSYTDKVQEGCQVVADRLPSGCQVVAEVETQCSVVENSIVENSIVECSVNEIHAQLDTEILTKQMYNTLLSKFQKTKVDRIIKRILEKPYRNCLNVKTIEEWCSEEKIQKKNKFNNFHQRDYDFDELEPKLLEC